jgi:hypothetical protein
MGNALMEKIGNQASDLNGLRRTALRETAGR